ncbi:MBL fold metallo-hydrolase [Bacillus salacetis]|uniref:beta-lactamase n=1 Tax=Bacillus salacetis TaxID=2315464 RepID=A0A3A1QTU5_9BACI|nr:MBL fold metallo-hydrolase [Bacillus salacetis]RIW30194.1 MBL fold metallo-hydrolase [Bacillus salacetis]
MELRKINENCYYFSSAVNAGYILNEGEGMLIDTGIDDSSIKKMLKILLQENLPLDYCIITHAHTDHFGGASYLKKKGIKLFAPVFEKAIMENPLLEPVYLWNGAFPLKELRNKFLEGKPVEIDEWFSPGEMKVGAFKLEALHLPGHSIGQAGIVYNDILFAADSYFGQEALEKHIVPFITDAQRTIETLERIMSLSVEGAVPGHGELERDITATIEANISLHNKLLGQIIDIAGNSKRDFDCMLKEFLDLNGIDAGSLGQYLLYRTSFTAYLTKLVSDGILKVTLEKNKIYISK